MASTSRHFSPAARQRRRPPRTGRAHTVEIHSERLGTVILRVYCASIYQAPSLRRTHQYNGDDPFTTPSLLCQGLDPEDGNRHLATTAYVEVGESRPSNYTPPRVSLSLQERGTQRGRHVQVVVIEHNYLIPGDRGHGGIAGIDAAWDGRRVRRLTRSAGPGVAAFWGWSRQDSNL